MALMWNECIHYCRCYWHSFRVPHIFWIVVEKYQDPTWGTQNFTTINFFWFYSWLTKGLFRNPLWSLLSQLISKSIDISTFYDQRGSDWCIYSPIRKVGHILYALSKMWPPCAPWGTKAPEGPWYRDEALGPYSPLCVSYLVERLIHIGP